MSGVALGLYLAEIGVGGSGLGLIVGAGLAGNAAATLLVAAVGDRMSPKPLLIGTTLLTAGGFIGLAAVTTPGPLAVASFLGLVNGMGRDRGPAQALDQAVLADLAAGRARTAAFARYSIIQDVLGGLGSLGAAIPAVLQDRGDVAPLTSYRVTFLAAGLVALLPALWYARLPAGGSQTGGRMPGTPISAPTRRRVAKLSALFALDSLGGGLLAGSILSYWFFHRFGLGGAVLGPVFLLARALNALSYLGAEALARRLGLLRTMVFTHLPSSLLLLLLPWLTRPGWAIGIFLLRECLVQMDVPTRQAYVATVTPAGERAFALAVTALTRNVGWAAGPGAAAAVMASFGIGAPLIAGALVKAAYDVLLYGAFRGLEPDRGVDPR